MKSDSVYMSLLFDYYGDLLTDKQKELFDLYYNEDLSLSEIAEHSDITRQGVRDAIVRAETFLRDTEDKLRLVRKFAGIENKLREIGEAADEIVMYNAGGKMIPGINDDAHKISRLVRQIIDEAEL